MKLHRLAEGAMNAYTCASNTGVSVQREGFRECVCLALIIDALLLVLVCDLAQAVPPIIVNVRVVAVGLQVR